MNTVTIKFRWIILIFLILIFSCNIDSNNTISHTELIGKWSGKFKKESLSMLEHITMKFVLGEIELDFLDKENVTLKGIGDGKKRKYEYDKKDNKVRIEVDGEVAEVSIKGNKLEIDLSNDNPEDERIIIVFTKQ